MKTFDEIDDMIQRFKAASPLQKLFRFFVAFFTLSSISSLSEVIIDWQGYFQDALIAYQKYFVGPIQSLGSKIGLHYTQEEVHVSVLATISFTISMRLLIDGQKVAFVKLTEKYGSKIEPNPRPYKISLFLAAPMIWLWTGVTSYEANIWVSILIFLLMPVLLIAPKELSIKKYPDSYIEKGSFSYLTRYYVIVAAILFIVGFLGALNAALN